MKRSGVLFAPAFLALAVGGCGGGIEEGMPKGDLPPTGQTDAFKNEMKTNAERMKNKISAKPKTTPAPSPATGPETKNVP
jgi:hypothetical protein